MDKYAPKKALPFLEAKYWHLQTNPFHGDLLEVNEGVGKG